MATSERKAIVVAKADELLRELQIREPAEIDIERIAIFKDAEVRYALCVAWMDAWFDKEILR